MTESRDDYGYIDKEEKDITIFKEQKTEGIEKQGLKFPFWQGINQFRRYKYKKLRGLLKSQIKTFKSLKSIDSDFKSSHFRKVLRHESKLIKVDFSKVLFLDYGYIVLYLIHYLGITSIAFLLTPAIIKDKFPILEWIGINLAYEVAIIFLTCSISVTLDYVLPLWKKSKYEKIAKAIVLPPLITFLCVIIYMCIFTRYVNDAYLLLFLKVIIPLGWLLSTAISLWLVNLISFSATVATWKKRRYAESILVCGLLEILYELENKSSLWVYQDFREKIWLKLKSLAFNLQFSSKGSFEDNKSYKKIGSALYDYELWLQEPRAHTYEDFKARIVKNLRCSISVGIGEVEQSETKIKKLVELESILARSIPLFLALLLPLWVLLAWEFLQRIPVISITPDLTKIKDQLIALLVIFAPFLAYGGELCGKIADKLLGLLPGSK
jgi:hypothetical protein